MATSAKISLGKRPSLTGQTTIAPSTTTCKTRVINTAFWVPPMDQSKDKLVSNIQRSLVMLWSPQK